MAEQTSKADRVKLNRELAQMLKGGVIMDVTTPEQARIAEEAGACAVMALERIPADIRAAGGVSRMSDPKMIKGIQEPSPSLLWPSAASGTLSRRRSCRPSRSITSTNPRFSPPPTMSTTSTRPSLTSRLSAVPATWARRCAVLPRAPR